MNVTAVLGYRFGPSWLALDDEEQARADREVLLPLVRRHRVGVRFFRTAGPDLADPYFLTVDAASVEDYYAFVEDLRDSAFIAGGWATLTRIVVGLRDGYVQYESGFADVDDPAGQDERRPYTVLVGYDLAPSWLSLSRDERNAYQAAHVLPVLGKYADRVEAEFYDTEAFTTTFSDLIALRLDDLADFRALVSDLESTPLCTEGHLTFRDALAGVEGAGFTALPSPVPTTLTGGLA